VTERSNSITEGLEARRMLNRALPAPTRDIAILVGRVILGFVLFAHGWQKLVINGISGTYGQFEKLGIPLAIVSASFASFVEFVGGVLIILGALTTTVVALDLVVMVGAAGFVHITHGVFAQDGGWELVGVIVAAELALAAFGPGRFSVDQLITQLREREHNDLRARMQRPVQRPATTSDTFTPVVATSAAPFYPTGGFATTGQVGWPLDAALRDPQPMVAPAARSAVTSNAMATEAFPVTSAGPTSVGAYVASAAAGASTNIFATPTAPTSAPTGAFAATSAVSTPTSAFAAVPPSVPPSGTLAAVTPDAVATGSASTDAAAGASAGSHAESAGATSPKGTPVAATVAQTVSLPVVPDVRAGGVEIDTLAAAHPAGQSLTAASPRMASAGVHRAMSERADRPASDVPAPFGVTVQSPLDFTPTTAFPVVTPSTVTETFGAAANPQAVRRRVWHTPDLPQASAVRPYA
jgi:putative oxidoreductase